MLSIIVLDKTCYIYHRVILSLFMKSDTENDISLQSRNGSNFSFYYFLLTILWYCICVKEYYWADIWEILNWTETDNNNHNFQSQL